MKKLFVLCILALTFSAFASAQEFQRFELFGGYTLLNEGIDPALAPVGLDRITNHGWATSFTVNATPQLGIVADFAGAYARPEVDGIKLNQDTYTFLFGPRFVPVRGKVFTPFAEFLLGAAHAKFSDGLGLDLSASDNAFALRAGGGLDIKLHRAIASRTQLGWAHTRFQDLNGGSQNHFHFATGVVFKFGK